MTKRPKPLSESELAQAVAAGQGKIPSPFVSPRQFAELTGFSLKTIYEWIAKGRLGNCARRRGKHVLIHRDRAINEIFSGKDWVKK